VPLLFRAMVVGVGRPWTDAEEFEVDKLGLSCGGEGRSLPLLPWEVGLEVDSLPERMGELGFACGEGGVAMREGCPTSSSIWEAVLEDWEGCGVWFADADDLPIGNGDLFLVIREFERDTVDFDGGLRIGDWPPSAVPSSVTEERDRTLPHGVDPEPYGFEDGPA